MRKLLLVIAVFVFLSPPVEAARKADNVLVQLAAFHARTLHGKTKREMVITPYLKVTKGSATKQVCSMVPKIRDAINQVIGKKRIKVVRKDDAWVPRFEPFAALLAKQINKSFRYKFVEYVKLAEGAKSMGSGVSSRLPGGSLGCRKIVVEEE